MMMMFLISTDLKVIPMMNPDGVYLGNYRGSLIGKDSKVLCNDS